MRGHTERGTQHCLGLQTVELVFHESWASFHFFFLLSKKKKNLIKSVIWQRKMAGEIISVIWEEVEAGNSANSKSLPKVLRCNQACLK